MDLITEIFEIIGQAVTNFATTLSSAVTSVTSMFYTPGVDGAAGSMTFLGVLLLIAAGVGLVWFAVRFIISLVSRAGR